MSGCNVFEKVLGYFNPGLQRHCGDLGSVCVWRSWSSGSINERREDWEEVDRSTEEHWCEAYSFMTVFRVSSMHLSLP